MASAVQDADQGGDKPAIGALTLAAVIKCAVGSSKAEKDLADAVLVASANDECKAPREAESIAQCFNRQMDVVLDAANDSAHEQLRVTRRTRMASALDRAGLVLVDAGILADLIEEKAELIAYKAGRVTRPLPCAAECEAAGGEHHDTILTVDIAPYRGPYVDDGTGGDFIGGVGPDPLGGNPNVND